MKAGRAKKLRRRMLRAARELRELIEEDTGALPRFKDRMRPIVQSLEEDEQEAA